MKVFISYSAKDLRLVHAIAAQITPHAQPVFWDKDQPPGRDAWQSIFQWISESDCVLVVLTDNVLARGESVNQEIGYAKAKGKVIIPLVAPGVSKERLGCLHGVTYLAIDDFPKAIGRLNTAFVGMNAAKQQQNAWVMVGIVAFVIWAMSQEK